MSLARCGPVASSCTAPTRNVGTSMSSARSSGARSSAGIANSRDVDDPRVLVSEGGERLIPVAGIASPYRSWSLLDGPADDSFEVPRLRTLDWPRTAVPLFDHDPRPLLAALRRLGLAASRRSWSQKSSWP